MDMDYKILEIVVWPMSIIIFLIFFSLFFKKEISEKIHSISSVSKDGVFMGQNQKINQSNFINEDLLGKNDSIVTREQKEKIKKDLKERYLYKENDETDEILIHQLAVTQIVLEFERIYNIIFGSQIYLLKKLNITDKHKNEIDAYISDILKSHDDLSEWNIDEYLNFLLSKSLIVFNSSTNTYSITNIGHEFLLWMIHAGKSENRNF